MHSHVARFATKMQINICDFVKINVVKVPKFLKYRSNRAVHNSPSGDGFVPLWIFTASFNIIVVVANVDVGFSADWRCNISAVCGAVGFLKFGTHQITLPVEIAAVDKELCSETLKSTVTIPI